MIRLYIDKDLCPCDSGKLLGNCCIGPNKTFRTTPASTSPPGPQTGFSNARCYASQLADCSPLMSREHFISHGILKVLSRGGTVTIDGFNWQEEGVTQELPTATVSSRFFARDTTKRWPALTLWLFDSFRQLMMLFN